MKKSSLSSVERTMNYVSGNWPYLMPFVPDNALPFDKGFGIGEGVCTHPGILDDSWFRSTGFHEFSRSELPGGFFCVGCQNRGGSEYLFMMWYSDGRKFWFYDQYVVFMGSGFPASVKRTGERLAKALKNWEGTSEDILYSGIGDRFWKKDELR